MTEEVMLLLDGTETAYDVRLELSRRKAPSNDQREGTTIDQQTPRGKERHKVP